MFSRADRSLPAAALRTTRRIGADEQSFCMAALFEVEQGSQTAGDGLEHVMASSSRLAALDEHEQ